MPEFYFFMQLNVMKMLEYHRKFEVEQVSRLYYHWNAV